jgi:hypothetical protein
MVVAVEFPTGVTFTNDPLRVVSAVDAEVFRIICGVNVVAALVLISAFTIIGTVNVSADAAEVYATKLKGEVVVSTFINAANVGPADNVFPLTPVGAELKPSVIV